MCLFFMHLDVLDNTFLFYLFNVFIQNRIEETINKYRYIIPVQKKLINVASLMHFGFEK